MNARRFVALAFVLAACGSSAPHYNAPPTRSTVLFCKAVPSDGLPVYLDDATWEQCRDFRRAIEGP